MPEPQKPTIGVVLLSMGNRTEELSESLSALAKQEGVEIDTVLVGNGWEPTGIPEWVRTVYEPENLGVPEGRNRGAQATSGEFIFFYDDDGKLPDTDTLARMVTRFEEDVALVQPRGVDPTGKPSPRRWSPRLRTQEGGAGGDVAVFWEAMAMMRRSAFDEVGGWPGEFFFGHEGIDLAMRFLDAGWRLRYEPDIVVHHPAHPASRHAVFYFTNARNRVWVARRNLPVPCAAIYLGVWVTATVVRVRKTEALKPWFAGFFAGFKGKTPGGRKPISWRTVGKMTRLGRPPVW